MGDLVTLSEDFSGGKVAGSPAKLGRTQSSELRNLIHFDGNLRSFPGKTRYNQTEVLTSTPVSSIYPFYKTGHRVNDEAATTKKHFPVIRCGEYLWVGIEESATLTETAELNDGHIHIGAAAAKLFPSSGRMVVWATQPYTLDYTEKDETTGTLTCVNTAIASGTRVSVCEFRPILKSVGNTNALCCDEMNDRLYMAFGHRWMWRFDGFYYAVSTVARTSGSKTWTGNNVDFTYLKPGDKVFARKNGTWSVQYEIESVNAAAKQFNTTVVSETTSAADDYIVVRVHKVGIESPGTPPALTAAAGDSDLDAPGTYKYAYTILGPSGESTRSDLVTASTVNAGDFVSLRLNLSPPLMLPRGAYYVRFYRTDGTGTEATLAKLVDIPLMEATVNTGPFDYQDFLADASLGALYTARTVDPDPIYTPKSIPVATVKGSGSALEPGTRQVAVVLYNSLTDTRSNPSQTASIVTTTGQNIQVVVNLVGCDTQADKIEIYSTRADGDILKYATIADRTAGASTQTIVLSASDEMLGDMVVYDNDSCPSYIKYVKHWNGHLFAWGYDTRYWWSTTGDPEHWPGYEWGVNEPTFTDPTLGGFIRLKNIPVGAVGDIGAYSTNGTDGGTMLVMSKSHAWQVSGRNWESFRFDEVWAGGCASHQSCANCGGIPAWIQFPDGPVIKPSGSPLAERIYAGLFPTSSKPFSGEVTASAAGVDYFEKCSGVYWRDCYIFTWCQTPSTIPNRMGALHLPSMTFTELGTDAAPFKAACLSVWSDDGDDGSLYMGDAEKGYVWKMFSKWGTKTYSDEQAATGVAVQQRTGFLMEAASPEKYYNKRRAGKLVLAFTRPVDEDQTITVKVWKDGSLVTAADSKTKTIATAGNNYRVYVDCGRMDGFGRELQIEWSGTLTNEIALEGILFEQTGHGANI